MFNKKNIWYEYGNLPVDNLTKYWDADTANFKAKWPKIKRWNLQNDPETKEIMGENLTEYRLR